MGEGTVDAEAFRSFCPSLVFQGRCPIGKAGEERRFHVSVLCSSDKILGLVCLGEKQEVVDLGCNPTGKD